MSIGNPPEKTLRVGIAGCGKVAEYHARFLAELPCARLVAVADRNLNAARDYAARHQVADIYSSLEDMLNGARLDVLHVVTPPSFHYECARAALERGIHVFVEKPVAFTAAEVSDLYELAARHWVRLCPDFIQLFHPRMQQLLARLQSGALGRVLHVDSYLAFNLADSPELCESEGLHWAYRLPGGLLRDYASHVLYLALSFTGRPQHVQVSRKSLGSLPQGMVDHLAIQVDGANCTASVLLSSALQSSAYGLRLTCEKGAAEVNFETQSLVIRQAGALPRRIALAAANFTQSWSLSSQGAANIWNYLRGQLVPYAGLRQLLPQFYAAILNHAEPPVAPELALATTEVEQEIFSGAAPIVARGPFAASAPSKVTRRESILVTGATGYVGYHVTRALVQAGYAVRVLARATSKLERLRQLGVEIFLGDIRRYDDLAAAAEGRQIIVHLAAGISGNSKFVVDASLRGTETVAAVAAERGVERVLYLSSFSVYDYTRIRSSQEITEDSPLEEHAEKRGAYTIGKVRAEHVALANLRGTPPWTILRPSLIVGQGRDVLAPVGSRIGNWVVCLSSSRKYLPLVHVDDVAAAILQLLQHPETAGEVFNLSHPGALRVRDYVRKCVRVGPEKLRVIYLPYGLARLLAFGVNILGKLTGRAVNVDRRRLLSSYRSVRAGSGRLQQRTGWQPRGDVLQRALQPSEPASAESSAELDHMAVSQA